MNALDYRVSTVGDTPADMPTLLLHGFLGRGRDWDGVSALLPGRRITPDLPGHGKSVGLMPELYTMDGAATAVVGVLDDTGTDKCNVVGYSMGGRLALYLALRHPERVSSLVLESASPGLKTDKERTLRRKSDEDLARRLEAAHEEDFRDFLEKWHRQPLFASLANYKGLVERLVSSRTDNDPAELARSLRGMGTGSQPSLRDELPDLEVPALAVAGEYDEKFIGIARKMSELSPNIESTVVGGAGHNVHVERPEEFADLLRSCFR